MAAKGNNGLVLDLRLTPTRKAICLDFYWPALYNASGGACEALMCMFMFTVRNI